MRDFHRIHKGIGGMGEFVGRVRDCQGTILYKRLGAFKGLNVYDRYFEMDHKDALYERIYRITKDMEWFQQDIQRIHQDIQRIHQDIETIKKEIQMVQQEIETLKKYMGTAPEDIEELKKRILACKEQTLVCNEEILAYREETLACREERLACREEMLEIRRSDLVYLQGLIQADPINDPITEEKMNAIRYDIFMEERRWMQRCIKRCRYTEVSFYLPSHFG